MGENNSEFHFYAKPYLLKLNFFPNGFVDQDEDCKGQESGVGTAKYDPSKQTVSVPLLKQKPKEQLRTLGEDDDGNIGSSSTTNVDNIDNHWPDLELTARMIQPKEIPKKWLHTVVDESDGEENEDGDEEDEKRSVEQEKGISTIYGNTLESGCGGDGYGFANMFRNIFTDYCRSGLSEEMLQLKLDPENSSIDERRAERLDHESKNFDFDRYLADLELCEDSTEDYLYPMVMAFEPWWRKSRSKQKSTSTTATLVQDMDRLAINNDGGQENTSITMFSNEEKLLLSTIPYPLIPKRLIEISSAKQTYRLWCGILELVLAYIYDHLATMGDSTVESAWTIFILSPGLSWLDNSPSKSVEKTTKNFLRRLLVYPYWRNAESLGRKVLIESLTLMQEQGIHGITKALLQIRAILDKSEVYYLGNKLFVDPYLYWIQNLQEQPGEDSYLGRMIYELAREVNDEKSFQSLVEDVETSLEIDVLIEECFGDDRDEEGDNDITSSSENDSDSNCSSGSHSSNHEKNQVMDIDVVCERGDEKQTVMVQLLDDQIGHGIADVDADVNGNENGRGQKPSMLYCVGDNEPQPAVARPLITEMRSEASVKKTNLIVEM